MKPVHAAVLIALMGTHALPAALVSAMPNKKNSSQKSVSNSQKSVPNKSTVLEEHIGHVENVAKRNRLSNEWTKRTTKLVKDYYDKNSKDLKVNELEGELKNLVHHQAQSEKTITFMHNVKQGYPMPTLAQTFIIDELVERILGDIDDFGGKGDKRDSAKIELKTSLAKVSAKIADEILDPVNPEKSVERILSLIEDADGIGGTTLASLKNSSRK